MTKVLVTRNGKWWHRLRLKPDAIIANVLRECHVRGIRAKTALA